MDDRLALRIGAFRLARWRGRTRDTAWAASRLRLAGVSLEPTEARFARAMRVKFGHALRVARIRRGRPTSAHIAMPLLETETRSRRRLLIAGAISALVLLGALFLFLRPSSEGGEPEGAPPSQVAVIATPPPPLRGRTEPGFAVPVAVVVATPAPEAPAASAPVAGSGTGTSGGGTGSGGSGGGGGTGTGKGTPAPTPKPTPTPVPTIDPNFAVHITGRVIDATSLQGLPGVCISIGDLDCSLSPFTNSDGSFDVILDGRSTSTWSFRFIKAGYVALTQRVPGGQSFNTGTLRLRRSP